MYTEEEPEGQEIRYLPESLESFVPFTSLDNRQVALFAAVNLLASIEIEPDTLIVAEYDAMAVGVAGRFLEWLEKP